MCDAVLNDRAAMFREAHDVGVSFISRSWVALQLGSSDGFVKWN